MNKGKQALYNDLKQQIISLELAPGADLDEMQLSKQYGISRTPLRDVFRHLAGEGYLKIADNRGACVSPMSHKTLRDFFLTAPMIYAAIGRLASRNANDEMLDQLEVIQARFDTARRAGSTIELALHNNDFHHLIGKMADNEFLMPSFQRLLIDHARIANTFYRANDPALMEKLSIAGTQHNQMIAAFRARDEQLSEDLVYAHWHLSREFIEPSITPDSLTIGL